MKNSKPIIGIIIASIIVMIAVAGGLSVVNNASKTDKQVTQESVDKQIEKLMKNITVTQGNPPQSPVDLLAETDLADELPTFDANATALKGNGDINLTVFCSPEKFDDNGSGWLYEVGKKFNGEQLTVGDKTVSVTLYNLTSGLMVDYIKAGVVTPDLMSPSSQYWGRMLEVSGAQAKLLEESIAGNVAGFVITNEKYDEIESEYGSVNVQTVVKAVSEGKLVFGYTTPNTSSAGLGFVSDCLYSFDSANPLSETAVAGFNAFQTNVPFVANTTMQMKNAAASGSLEAFVYESQVWENSKDLHNKFQFVPYGIRHDNPVYATGNLTDEETQAAKLFIDYCKTDASLATATKYGFNTFSGYVPEYTDFSGQTLLDAQKLWKENKDAGKDICAVFVTDVSLSMDGDPINSLKKALINGMQYIGENNRIGLVSYSADVQIDLPIDQFMLTQKSKFKGAVEGMSAMSSTATCDAVVVAIDMVRKDVAEHPDCKTVIILLADGGQNTGHDLREIQDVVKQAGIPVYTIGYNEEVPLLDKLSAINEAVTIDATSDDVTYKIKNLFNTNL